MAPCKTIDTSPRFLAVDLRAQRMPGTIEHALDWIVDWEVHESDHATLSTWCVVLRWPRALPH